MTQTRGVLLASMLGGYKEKQLTSILKTMQQDVFDLVQHFLVTLLSFPYLHGQTSNVSFQL
jgi:hypothetical protein